MRKNLFLLAIASALLTLSSCKKVFDYVKDHPNGTANNCKIDKITFTGARDWYSLIAFDDTMSFSYDNRGNLTKFNFALALKGPYATVPDSYFLYDNRNRIVHWLENYNQIGNSIGALIWHKYEHINSNTIIDTTFSYADGSWDGVNLILPSGQPFSITHIELDDFGRIVHETTRAAGEDYLYGEKYYNYDQSGNLILPGVSYTNKTSILQTNKTLMFISRDYSLNCQVGAASQFNSNNLPVKFNSGKSKLIGNDGTYPDNQKENLIQIDQKITVYYNCK